MPDQELRMHLVFDPDTGKIQGCAVEFQKLKQAAEGTIPAVQKTEAAINSSSSTFRGFSAAQGAVTTSTERTSTGILRLVSSVSGLNGITGGAINQGLQLAHSFDAVGQSGISMSSSLGKATSSFTSAAGVVGLVIVVFTTFYAIMRKIMELFDWDEPVQNFIGSMTGLDQAGRETMQTLEGVNRAAADRIWERTGKAIDLTGLSIEEANKKLVEFLHNLNQTRFNEQNALAGAIADVPLGGPRLPSGAEYVRQLEERERAAAAAAERQAEQTAEAQYKIYVDGLNRQLQARRDHASALERIYQEEQARREAEMMEEVNAQIAAYREEEAANQNLQNAVLDAALARQQREKEMEQEVADQIAEYRMEAMQKFSETVSQLGNQMSQLGQDIDSQLVSNIGNAANVFSGEFESKIQDGASKTQAALGGLSSAFVSISMNSQSAKQAIISAIIAITLAIASSGWGAIVIAVGALASALARFLGKDWVKDVQKFTSEFGKLSKGLSDQIKSLAKEVGDTNVAIALSLGRIADEVGVSSDNIDVFFQKTHDLFTYLAEGRITAQQVSEVLGDMFPRLAEYAEQYGGQYMVKLREIIDLTKQFGVEVPAITDWINEQIDTLVAGIGKYSEDFGKFIDRIEAKYADLMGKTWNVGLLSESDLKHVQGQFNKLVDFVAAAFTEMQKAGMSMSDIVAKLKPYMDQLRDAAKQFGLQNNEAYKALLQTLGVMDEFQTKLERIKTLGDIYTALGNLGSLTEKQFRQFGASIKQTFDQMVAGGATGSQALAAMAPQLNQLYQLQQQYGYQLTAAQQKLVDMAMAQGLIKPDPMDMLLQALAGKNGKGGKGTLLGALGDLNDTLNSFKQLLSSMNGQTYNVNVNTNYTSTGTPPPGGNNKPGPNGDGVDGSAASGPVRHIKRRGLWMLDPGDVVIPPTGNPIGPQIQTGDMEANWHKLGRDASLGPLSADAYGRRRLYDDPRHVNITVPYGVVRNEQELERFVVNTIRRMKKGNIR
jgi:hypothetical protein